MGKKLVLLLFASMAASSPSQADTAPDVTFIKEGGPVLAPFADVVFCLKYPGECVSRGQGAMIDATPRTLAMLNAVNKDVNRSILPRNDPSGEDNWDVDPKYGDCEDYAITKRKRLIDHGLPSAATRLAVALTHEGIGHVVVVERTTAGDLILDNRTDAIEPWQNVDLRWLKIQSASNPQMWKDISAEGRPRLFAVRFSSQ